MLQDSSTLQSLFKNPGKEFSPTPFWWWSGEALDPDRLRWQMQQLAGAGVYNLVIINLAPSGPLFGKDADQPPMFSEAWWGIFKGVCEDARTLGMQLYFYDQIGFSGANFQGKLVAENPIFGGQELLKEELQVREGQQVRLPIGNRIIAVFFWGESEEEPERLSTENHTVCVPATGRLMIVNQVAKGFDYYNPAACQQLLDTIHGQFEAQVGSYFGDVIVGSFQDELPHMPTWSNEFAAQFKETYGYDLIEHLWMLWEGNSPKARQTRVHYHTLRGSLAEEAFFKPFYLWHEHRGLICGFDQQDPARAGSLYGGVRIYGDYLKTHRWFEAPGSDQGGETHVHRSLADAYGRQRIWMEGFHSSGWGGTLEETFDWLLPRFRNGANLYNPHAVYYSTRCGWWEWAPPSTCFRQPYWRHYKSFADTVARCCQALTLGTHVCDLAIYYPATLGQAGTRLEGPDERLEEAMNRILQLTGRTSLVRPEAGILDELGIDYNFLDDAMLESGNLDGNSLHIGGQRYETLILPSATIVSAAVMRVLLNFAHAGGTLIAFGESPKHVLGDNEGHFIKNWQIACEQRHIQLARNKEQLETLLKDRPAWIDAPVPVHHRCLGQEHLAFVPATYTTATNNFNREAHGRSRDYGYTFERSRYAREMTLLIRHSEITIEAWSPVSGSRLPIETKPVKDGTEVTLCFEDSPAIWLSWQKSQDATDEECTYEAHSQKGMQELAVLPAEWGCQIIPTADNRYSDLASPASDTLPLQTWFVEQANNHTVDNSEVDWEKATREHVTFGTFGWRKLVNANAPFIIEPKDTAPGKEWEKVRYSLTRGMELEARNLGPSGHVAEDFIDLGKPLEGQAAHFRTWIPSPRHKEVILVVGAPGELQVSWNGAEIEEQQGFRQQWSVTLQPGLNRLDFRVVPLQANAHLRAHWCLLSQPLEVPWPSRIACPEKAQAGRFCRFFKKVHLTHAVTDGVIQILSLGATRLFIDGQEIGCHGSFGPYEKPGKFEASHYQCPPLSVGPHTLEVNLTDAGVTPQLTFDAILQLEDGRTTNLISDDSWLVESQELQTQPVALTASGNYDPGYETLHRRPHPLPDTDWLEQPSEASPVLSLTPEAYPNESHVYWFRWLTPPGAKFMTLAINGDYQVWLDGEAIEQSDGKIHFPNDNPASHQITLRVKPDTGYHDGAIFAAAPTYKLSGQGQMKLGDWTQQGLESWSGGVAYTQNLSLDKLPEGRLILDLGELRGTAEVEINGNAVGNRFCAPWHFDITNFIGSGSNAIRVTVYNTLAPWLGATSPTIYVFNGQTASGLFGPVRLLEQTSTHN